MNTNIAQHTLLTILLLSALSNTQVADCDRKLTLSKGSNAGKGYDMGTCNAAWAFALAAASTDVNCAYNYNRRRYKVAKYQFSPDFLLQCCEGCHLDEVVKCEGGSMERAIIEINRRGMVRTDDRTFNTPAGDDLSYETQVNACFNLFKPTACIWAADKECKMHDVEACPEKCPKDANQIVSRNWYHHIMVEKSVSTVAQKKITKEFIQSFQFDKVTLDAKLATADKKNLFHNHEVEYIIGMEIFTDIFDYTPEQVNANAAYIHKRGFSMGVYPVRIISYTDDIVPDPRYKVNHPSVWEGESYEIITPFAKVGDFGRIWVPAGVNHCGIEGTNQAYKVSIKEEIREFTEDIATPAPPPVTP